MNTGRILAIVFGSLAILIGLGGLTAASGVLFVNALRDDDGYITSPTERLTGNGFAVVSEEVQIEGPIPGDDLVDIRIQVESADARHLGEHRVPAGGDLEDVVLRDDRPRPSPAGGDVGQCGQDVQ